MSQTLWCFEVVSIFYRGANSPNEQIWRWYCLLCIKGKETYLQSKGYWLYMPLFLWTSWRTSKLSRMWQSMIFFDSPLSIHSRGVQQGQLTPGANRKKSKILCCALMPSTGIPWDGQGDSQMALRKRWCIASINLNRLKYIHSITLLAMKWSHTSLIQMILQDNLLLFVPLETNHQAVHHNFAHHSLVFTNVEICLVRTKHVIKGIQHILQLQISYHCSDVCHMMTRFKWIWWWTMSPFLASEKWLATFQTHYLLLPRATYLT